jgi:hypothetical protein
VPNIPPRGYAGVWLSCFEELTPRDLEHLARKLGVGKHFVEHTTARFTRLRLIIPPGANYPLPNDQVTLLPGNIGEIPPVRILSFLSLISLCIFLNASGASRMPLTL